MNEKDFSISREDSKNLLNKFKLLRNYDFYQRPIPESYYQHIRNKHIVDTYLFSVQNLHYHFLLFDESIMQFNFSLHEDEPLLKYFYYQFPFDFPSYKNWLINNDMKYEEYGDSLKDRYEQQLFDADIRESVIRIRYDCSHREYTPGIHSVSHFHFGHENTIRIPSDKIINPLLFVLFILKQIYYEEWKSLIKISDFIQYVDISKSQSKEVDNKFFNEIDKKELYLI